MAEVNPEVVKLVGVLVSAFRPRDITPDDVRTYARLLSDVPVEILAVAVEQCANDPDREFFPKPGEIRKYVAMVSESRKPNSAEAWEEVMIAIKRDGFYRHPKFDDSILQRAVELMDWQALCSSENTVADRAHFIKLYDGLVAGDKQEKWLLPAARNLRAEITDGRRPRLLQGSTDAEVQGRGSDSL